MAKQKEQKQQDKTIRASNQDLLPVGGEEDFHDEWPRLAPTQRFRLLHANVHGFHPSHNNMELDYFIQQMVHHQVDMPTVVEVNQPLANGMVRTNIKTCIKHFDKHARVNFGYPDTPTTKTGWQMGGTMSYVQGGAAGLVNKAGRDECGRWTWTDLGQDNLCVVNAYRVGPGTDGTATIRSMEMRQLMQKKHPLAKNPRKAFDKDMAKFVTEKKAENSPVLLLMDANAPPDSPEIKNFMRKTGMKNLFRVLHPHTPFPRTYDRGQHCLDMAFVCDDAVKYVKKMGYLPFYDLGPDDHRAFFIDLYYARLRATQCMEDNTKSTLSTPSLRRPAEVRSFIDTYKTLLERTDLFDKVEKIKERFAVASDQERPHLIARLEKYDTVWVQLARAALKKSKAKAHGIRAWSPIFALKGAICRYWNCRLRVFYLTGQLETETVKPPEKYTPPMVHSEEGLVQLHTEALKDWHQTKGNAAALRTQHLEDLIQYYMDQQNLKREQAVKQILHWEEVRNLHTRQSQMMTPSKPNVIKTLIIPKPHSTDPNAMMEISDPDHIQQIILQRNANKLGAAHGTPFTVDPLAQVVGQHGDTTQADDMLNGNFNVDIVDEWTDIAHRDHLKLFLQHLQRPRAANGEAIPDMPWEYGAEEFRETFSRKREDTACGPSGITMQFYRMFCLDDDLATMHATFIYLPFKYGFSLSRWQNSVHFMLMKIEIPLWEKLRIIQLMEGDFNGGLRYIFGRKLMHYSATTKTSSDSTYGGRPGRNCHDALLRIQLSMEYCRLQRKMAAFKDIDATACFDNQIRNLIGIMTRRMGADRNISRCQTETLEKMKHRVRIQHGVSKDSITHTEDSPLYGSGQGSGAGVVNWHGHNEALIAMYNETQKGCVMKSPDETTEIEQKVISFVDDNKLIQAFPWDMTQIQAMILCTISINFWRIMLEISGGLLAAMKCKLQFLTFDFNTYSYSKHYPNRGTPIMQTNDQQEGQCKLYDSAKSDYHIIEKIEPHKGRKLLGVRLAADGNCTDEYLARKQQSEKLAQQLAASSATPVDAFMIYVFRYCPAVFYCIPITYFTAEQCKAIQAPFMNVLLPKLRINRHVKRDVVWGPKRYGGLGLAHMETEQYARTVGSLVGHVRASTPTGTTFLITCGAYQLYLGIQKLFFLTVPDHCPHRPSNRTSKLTYMWETLYINDGALHMRDMWTPPERNTPCIMDLVTTTQQRHKGTAKCIRDEDVRLVNTCRIWLRALYVEDILTSDGFLRDDFLLGTQQCTTQLLYPNQPRPPDWVWKIWKKVLLQTCFKWDNGRMRYMNQPNHTTLITPVFRLPPAIDKTKPLEQIVSSLPAPYQQILGKVEYPEDDGCAIAMAIKNGSAMNYSDGTVDDGCGAHAYTVRPESDDSKFAITGEAPTCGDPDTISSLRTEHFGALAGIIWIWILAQKYEIEDGTFGGAIDNVTVVNRLNEGIDKAGGHTKQLRADIDVWTESCEVLNAIPLQFNFRHVKGHQDDMHKRGVEGPLPRDAFWNVQMDRRAEKARLQTPMESNTIFGSSAATFLHKGLPVNTKIRDKIRTEVLTPPLRRYIQRKEDWDNDTFDAVDWRAFEICMNKLTIHKRINVAKYVFNWQNTGRQKQHFEETRAKTEQRQAENVGMCPMGCGNYECSQHYLRCRVLHDAKLLTRDFQGISKWMKKVHTCPELQIIIEKSLTNWMEGKHNIEIWELEDTPYRTELELAIQAQNFIGWANMLKGRIATTWGNVQMAYYEDYYDELPKHVSATWWSSEFIRQLLYFSLAAWQHRNNYLHNALDQERKVADRMDAVEHMATWYDREHEFPDDDKPNFSRSFLERCTDTTAQIRLWLGKIIDIYNYNQTTTLRRYFSVRS